ncbi:hypothetical protein PLICRDRAFT_118717 [Plicaturopsis crispa FD-325 SS-3]|uniref:Rab-GAP TBC domain-containing protein n=1 Tax=Plicaturopsis crispa FD-325 SS-3 TaxID=944288 RepID=A0A0C9T3M1_PLICR|nr:hypothetical protein PLICRDRAFT_118717 [Plicaturopsis crispa FD-325 SS-3]
MDFELVRPTIPQVSSPRTSEDAPSLGHLPDVRPDHAGLLRAESPANSIRSAPAGVPRPPTAVSEVSNVSTSKAPKPQDSQATMDAHRQRELKWMTVMSSTPAAQAKKSKKVKKLLFEGVPASVRYLVWAHLTDSKAKGMAGLYFQLGKRGKVSASHDIERDIRKFFMDHSQIHCTQASVAALLQAYITMVPDIQYDPGLTCIAGHLLSLSPEEDAFWIFVSLMDAFLRPYFSLNTTQMEVDGALFCKAVENNDAAVAKKIFVDMGMSPVTVCRPWFTNLFAESLPTEYLLRVWDIFFFEGIPFLFRVGLALFQCCRRQLLDATGEQAVMLNLLHPQPNSLPPTAEAFVTLAHSMKLKDDDLRKQRVKMEAQVKRQAQSRVPGGSISLPRS